MSKTVSTLSNNQEGAGSPDFDLPPWSEGQVEVLAQVEDVDRQPAHHEQAERGNQHQAAPDVPPLLRDPPAVTHERNFWIKFNWISLKF